MLSKLTRRPGSLAAAALLAALSVAVVAPGARAQEGGGDERSEAERQKAARAEQEERRRAAEEAERDATRAAEEEAERERLESLGATATGTLLEEQAGFFLRLDAFLAQVDGADTAVARVGDIATSATTAEELDSDGDGLPDAFTITGERTLRLEYDTALTPQVEVGWRLKSGAAISVRWWSLSGDASASATSSLEVPPSGAGAPLRLGGIDSPGQENDATLPDRDPAALARPLGSIRLVSENRLHGADSVVVDGKVEASRLDLLYGRTALARRRFALSYRVGLSVLDLERRESATWVWRSLERAQVALEANAVETVTTSSDTSAFGATAGVAGKWLFGDKARWGVRFGVDVAGLKADPDESFRDAQVFDDDVVEPRETVYQDVTSGIGEDFISVIEGDLALEGRVGDRFQISVGYRHSSWVDAVTDLRFPDPDNGSLMTRDLSDLDFAGPYVRFGLYF